LASLRDPLAKIQAGMANTTAVPQHVKDVFYVRKRTKLMYCLCVFRRLVSRWGSSQMEFLILGSISFVSALWLCCYQI